MSMSDTIADMFTRVRNAHQANKPTVAVPASALLKRVLDVLQREGYVRGYKQEIVRTGVNQLIVELKYIDGQPAIQRIKRVSTPGRRVYSQVGDLPKVHNGLGTLIVSTSKGVLSDMEARTAGVGGEIIGEVF
jgi:small subunit ribosomal protein S8